VLSALLFFTNEIVVIPCGYSQLLLASSSSSSENRLLLLLQRQTWEDVQEKFDSQPHSVWLHAHLSKTTAGVHPGHLIRPPSLSQYACKGVGLSCWPKYVWCQDAVECMWNSSRNSSASKVLTRKCSWNHCTDIVFKLLEWWFYQMTLQL